MKIVKSKLTRLIFRTIYCTLAIIAIMGSLGYFDASFNTTFYVYYTNLSNYICIGLMFSCLIFDIKYFNTDREKDVAPKFKFMSMIMILVTFLVYNILLAKDYTVKEYFTSISNLLNHVILPVMFILDWILFYTHGKTKWYYPLLCLIMPLIYVVYILIRASILKAIGHSNTLLYPYFFLDLDTLGVGGFIGWIVALVLIFVAIGYLFYLADRFAFRKKLNQNTKISEQEDNTIK